MKRRDLLFAALFALLPIPAIGVSAGRVPMPRMFALVYTKGSKTARRLIDTSMDVDDSHLGRAWSVLADDEVMELFPQHAFEPKMSGLGPVPLRLPRYVAPFIGTGVIV